jgi:hypothetical protein
MITTITILICIKLLKTIGDLFKEYFVQQTKRLKIEKSAEIETLKIVVELKRLGYLARLSSKVAYRNHRKLNAPR